MTTIKKSKVTDLGIKNFGDKTSTNNSRIKEISSQIAESLYATQARLTKLKQVKEGNHSVALSKHLKQKVAVVQKHGNKRSKEELKQPTSIGTQVYAKPQNKPTNVMKKFPEQYTEQDSVLQNNSLDTYVKQSHAKKMSEDTYIEPKESLTNLIKNKKKSLMSKKWRREIKQKLDNDNLFKQSKEKKLDFSIKDSPVLTKGREKLVDLGLGIGKHRGSIQRIRCEIIQDDSEDEQVREYQTQQASSINASEGRRNELVKEDDSSYESNPLQRIIEQRQQELTSEEEESEDELDDDYDVGIDDIELASESNINEETEVTRDFIFLESKRRR